MLIKQRAIVSIANSDEINGMMIKKYACISMLIGLSSVVSLTIAVPSIANPEPIASAQQQTDGTLRQGIPGRRIGGGTRSDRLFEGDYASLSAMVPANNLGVTTATHPTLLFAIPEMVSANTVEFVMRDHSDQLIYETTFAVSREGGVVSINTAEAPGLSALALNENYQWYFSIVPDLDDRANDVVVHGSIRRVDQAEWFAQQQIDSTVADQLAIAPPLLKARLYQQANLWHDAALILTDLHQADPGNEAIAAEWQQLLESAGLENISQSPQPHLQISLN